jgi:hypothetical protein
VFTTSSAVAASPCACSTVDICSSRTEFDNYLLDVSPPG